MNRRIFSGCDKRLVEAIKKHRPTKADVHHGLKIEIKGNRAIITKDCK